VNYDDAKDEALRMLDDERWRMSLWEAKQHFQNRLLALLYMSVSVVGFCAVNAAWPRFLISIGLLVVLHGYLWSYGYRIKVPIARIRNLLRRGLQDKDRRQARDRRLKA
jgi:hypothetical protein